MSIPPKSLEERFWSRVAPMMDDGGCWEWTGPLVNRKWSYGKIGREGGRGSGWTPASRASWEIHFGAVPEGMCVLHKCDNPACVNPAHLFIGTFKDNTNDMWSKGRGRSPFIQ
jgi:hypothetical protein